MHSSGHVWAAVHLAAARHLGAGRMPRTTMYESCCTTILRHCGRPAQMMRRLQQHMPVGLQGLMRTTMRGGLGPAIAPSSQSRSGCQVAGSHRPNTTLLEPPVICSTTKCTAFNRRCSCGDVPAGLQPMLMLEVQHCILEAVLSYCTFKQPTAADHQTGEHGWRRACSAMRWLK
jgi:hypothetical protein